MARMITIDLDSADYTSAVIALEWAFHNARRLNYTLPTQFTMALQLLKGEARNTLYLSTHTKGGFFSIVEGPEDLAGADDEDFDDIMALLLRRKKRGNERKRAYRAAGEIAALIGALGTAAQIAGPTCEKCGGPRSVGSARMCRECYISPERAYAEAANAPR